jgi:hypothetical protein
MFFFTWFKRPSTPTLPIQDPPRELLDIDIRAPEQAHIRPGSISTIVTNPLSFTTIDPYRLFWRSSGSVDVFERAVPSPNVESDHGIGFLSEGRDSVDKTILPFLSIPPSPHPRDYPPRPNNPSPPPRDTFSYIHDNEDSGDTDSWRILHWSREVWLWIVSRFRVDESSPSQQV